MRLIGLQGPHYVGGIAKECAIENGIAIMSNATTMINGISKGK